MVSDYNEETRQELTPETAKHSKEYLAYAAGRIELYSQRMKTLSTVFNSDGSERHTPLPEQRLLVYDDFQSRLQHVVQYQAFHDEMVALRDFISVPYWQGESDREKIVVTVQNDTDTPETVTVENITAVLFDRYALGTFRSEEETLTTPVNARARYYNVFHFAEQLWYNDLSENFVVFCND